MGFKSYRDVCTHDFFKKSFKQMSGNKYALAGGMECSINIEPLSDSYCVTSPGGTIHEVELSDKLIAFCEKVMRVVPPTSSTSGGTTIWCTTSELNKLKTGTFTGQLYDFEISEEEVCRNGDAIVELSPRPYRIS